MAEQIITAKQAHAFDTYTIEHLGVPSLVLMEHAAMAVVTRLRENPEFDLQHTLVVAGPGNNGGDGIAVARLLMLQHVPVTIWLLGNRAHLSMQAAQQLTIADNYGIPIITETPVLDRFSTIVDAIFGVGLTRPVTGSFGDAVKHINAANLPVLAIDVPTGIDTDTGAILGIAIAANETVTMSYNKVGLTTATGKEAAGTVTVANIGIYDPATLTNN
ncbi:NAD(P)H-hydrate epimerase [Furfurilactobacillus siliginis]|uniref:NAD(P)H-hydrate epimerase n=1 Tax=Furfurilactobacillus siliginis TaxID=348151 RepID=A0A0R2LBS0_9LACO|nr:NAD(P)H-hydrate epimerase [Furfurilactobacillus siliginis]KRN97142.1 yjef-like protein [Furfurilactobacillus siliginis]GEK28807.1 hypothetical protein LSI01_11180 [Furfurilactobacillus siliginis]